MGSAVVGSGWDVLPEQSPAGSGWSSPVGPKRQHRRHHQHWHRRHHFNQPVPENSP